MKGDCTMSWMKFWNQFTGFKWNVFKWAKKKKLGLLKSFQLELYRFAVPYRAKYTQKPNLAYYASRVESSGNFLPFRYIGLSTSFGLPYSGITATWYIFFLDIHDITKSLYIIWEWGNNKSSDFVIYHPSLLLLWRDAFGCLFC